MNEYNEVDFVDIFEVFSEDGEADNAHGGAIPVDEALFNCLNAFGNVNVDYISELCGLPIEQVTEELKGAIFQDPKQFLLGKEYDIASGWVLSSKYLGGNVRKKLSAK